MGNEPKKIDKLREPHVCAIGVPHVDATVRTRSELRNVWRAWSLMQVHSSRPGHIRGKDMRTVVRQLGFAPDSDLWMQFINEADLYSDGLVSFPFFLSLLSRIKTTTAGDDDDVASAMKTLSADGTMEVSPERLVYACGAVGVELPSNFAKAMFMVHRFGPSMNVFNLEYAVFGPL